MAVISVWKYECRRRNGGDNMSDAAGVGDNNNI